MKMDSLVGKADPRATQRMLRLASPEVKSDRLSYVFSSVEFSERFNDLFTVGIEDYNL